VKNKILKLVAAVLLVSMTGCMYQKASSGDILESEKICHWRGGINHITVNFASGELVVCQDEFTRRLYANE
jgi:hypothetical protein